MQGRGRCRVRQRCSWSLTGLPRSSALCGSPSDRLPLGIAFSRALASDSLSELRTSAQAGAYRHAVDAYTAAIDACAGTSLDGTAPAEPQPCQAGLCQTAAPQGRHGQQPSSAVTDRERATLHSNRAAAHERLGAFASALQDGLAAVDLAPHWPKAHLRFVCSPCNRAQSLANIVMIAVCFHCCHMLSVLCLLIKLVRLPGPYFPVLTSFNDCQATGAPSERLCGPSHIPAQSCGPRSGPGLCMTRMSPTAQGRHSANRPATV